LAFIFIHMALAYERTSLLFLIQMVGSFQEYLDKVTIQVNEGIHPNYFITLCIMTNQRFKSNVVSIYDCADKILQRSITSLDFELYLIGALHNVYSH